jgi:Tol biopolymer transport system component
MKHLVFYLLFLLLLTACGGSESVTPTPQVEIVEITATAPPATATIPATATAMIDPTSTPRPTRTPTPTPPISGTSDGGSTNPSISRDGRYIVFESSAYNISPDTPNRECTADPSTGFLLPCRNIYLYDRESDEITLVTRKFNNLPADGDSFLPVVSDDGRYVTYMSYATNLETEEVQCESNEIWYVCLNVFVYDRTTRRTLWVSRPADAPRPVNNSNIAPSSLSPSISGDGRYIVYMSRAENLVAEDGNGVADIFVFDQETATTRMISVSSTGEVADNLSVRPVISGDGRTVVFGSFASNLVADDTNNTIDVFAHDLETGETTRISVSSDGTEADGFSQMPSISYDGRYVTFESVATTLDPNDLNFTCDVNGDSDASENCFDVFLHDRETGSTALLSLSANGGQNFESSIASQISPNGSVVAFSNLGSGLVPQDGNDAYDLFVRDLGDTTTTRISVASDGTEGNHQSGMTDDPFGLRPSYALSTDGRYVVFGSSADNFVESDFNDGISCNAEEIEGYFAPQCSDIFLHDRETGETILISSPRKLRE